MACNHEFQGHKDGVTCLLCGLKMSGREYADYCTAKDLAAQGDTNCAQFVADVESGEYCTEANTPRITTETLKQKKRTPRKKKEAKTNV